MSEIKFSTGIILCLLVLFSCAGSPKKDDQNSIKVGITSGPEQQVAEEAKRVAKEKFNLDVTLVVFNDYVTPNEALNLGDIDVNVFQHVPYLDEQVKPRGYKLAVVGNTFVFPIVAYSRKIKTISELKEGNTIVIPNDPSNGGRALLLLQKQNLIKLRKGVGLLPGISDIVENPKRLNIEEIEAPQLPKVLDDPKVTIAVINNNFAVQAGLDAEKDGVFKEDKESPYVNVIVAREGNKNSENVRKFVQAYQSQAVEKVAEEVFKGGIVKGW